MDFFYSIMAFCVCPANLFCAYFKEFFSFFFMIVLKCRSVLNFRFNYDNA